MRHLTASSFVDKARLHSKQAFIPLFEVTVPVNDREERLLFCNWGEDVEYQGERYLGGNFDFSIRSDSNKMPVGMLSCFDPTGQLHQLLEHSYGAVGANVTIKVVNTASLESAPEFEEYFIVGRSSMNAGFVQFELSVPNYIAMRFPPRVLIRNFCGWTYKNAACGYQGEKPTCDYSLFGDNGCQAHNNTAHFGGFPSM